MAAKGQTTSEETKRKQSEAAKRRYEDPNERIKTGLSNKGKIRNVEQRKRISVGRTGKPSWNKGKTGAYSPEYREKLRKAHQGKKLTEEHKRNIGKVQKNKVTPYSTKVKISDAHIGHWYGAVKYVNYPIYCEKWNKDFRRRISAFNAYNHNGVVICECCGLIQTTKAFNRHHVYYDKKACCAVNEDGDYYSNLGIKGDPYTFEIIGDPNKFVVLCDGCHGYSNGQKDREYWARHYEKIVNEKYNGKSYFTKEEMLAYTREVCGNDPR
jgi:hypothetical protein